MAEQFVSLNAFAAGGGLKNDFDGTIKSARFVEYDYNGKSDAILAVCLEIVPDDGEVIQPDYISAGKLEFFRPSTNGHGAVKVGKATELSDSSNLKSFRDALVALGFPEDKLDTGDITVIEGGNYHFNRKPQKERAGQTKTAAQIEREKKYGPPTQLLPTAINTLPGEKKKGSSNTNAKPATAAAASSSSASGETDRATEVLLEILSSKGGKVDKKDLPSLAFKIGTDNVEKKMLARVLFNEDFLKSESAPWSYDGATITL